MTAIQTCKPLTKYGLQDLLIFNYAISMLQIRHTKEVINKAVGLTDNKKVLYYKRKKLKEIDDTIEQIIEFRHTVFARVHKPDFAKLRERYDYRFIEMIPEDATNAECLALYLLFVNFIDDPNPMLSQIFYGIDEFDYMKLIIMLTEDIGLREQIQDEMFALACKIIEEVKK